MDEMNKLDNISNMSDEELDAFIKSELNSSLMEDIKVDEELINKTMKAAYFADIQVNSEIHSNEITVNNKKTGSRLRKYIPILSMAACTCIIVMAASLMYSQIGKNKSENASVSNDESYSKVEDMLESDKDSYIGDGSVGDTIMNNQVGNSVEQDSLEDFSPEDSSPEADEEFDEDFKNDYGDIKEEPQSPSQDIIYMASKLLNIKDDNGEFLSMDKMENKDIFLTMYDELGEDIGQEEALEYVTKLCGRIEESSFNVLMKEFDDEAISSREYVWIGTDSSQYYIVLDEEGLIGGDVNVIVFEKH